MTGESPSGVLERARWGPPREAQGSFGGGLVPILAEHGRAWGSVGDVDTSTALCHGCSSRYGLWEPCVATMLAVVALARGVAVVVDELI